MLKFSSNYSLTEPCFVIQNMPVLNAKTRKKNKYLPAIKILKNILNRGYPLVTDITSRSTIPSEFLESHFEDTDYNEWFLPLLQTDINKLPRWHNIIKGSDEQQYNPAYDFLYTIWDKHLPEFSFIRQLIEPEVLINEILDTPMNEFHDQTVDFYLPCAGLVIEIDGIQHKKIDQNHLDNKRNAILRKEGIHTVRINAADISNESDNLKKEIETIRRFLTNKINDKKSMLQRSNYIKAYYEYWTKPDLLDSDQAKNRIALTYIFRFQMFLLVALERQILDMSASKWKIAILKNQIDQDRLITLACNDLNLWFRALCKLQKIEYIDKSIETISCNSQEEICLIDNCLHLDNDIFKRWTDETDLWPNVIHIRSDYDQTRNHFFVDTLRKPHKYKIISDGPDNDLTAIDYLLRNVFGYKSGFLEGQYQIITNVLRGNNTIGILPTGGGKTLCYLFASLLQPTISIIVSPLKSLMHDQKRNVKELAIEHTAYINSSQNAIERNKVLDDFSRGKYFFVWISPERFQDETFRTKLSELSSKKKIAYAIIDEVHCLSEWGHRFRTSYLTLVKTIKKYCSDVVLVGLTATASDFVLKDIRAHFGITETDVIIPKIFSRKNLNFQIARVHTGEEKYDLLRKCIASLDQKYSLLTPNEEKTKSTIVFAINKGSNSKKNHWAAKWIYNELRKDLRSENIAIFHGGSEETDYGEDMIQEQENFIDNVKPLIIATKAFGMGINKPNIRYVFQYGIPNSLEELYQQAGRAGRDNETAECLIIYTPDNLDNELRQKLFDPTSSVSEIDAIQKKAGNCDVAKQLFLWVLNYLGPANDIKLAYKLYLDHTKNRIETGNNNAELIDSNPNEELYFPAHYKDWIRSELSNNEEYLYENCQIQKALYQLNILGIVDDWTIDYNKKVIKAYFINYTDEELAANIIKHIRRYDVQFKLADKSQEKVSTSQYIKDDELSDTDILVYRLLDSLINWTYDNIVYARRVALKNIIDACDQYKDSESFKQHIDKFFAINDVSASLTLIAENPLEHQYWFSFFTKDFESVADANYLGDASLVLKRMFESNRFNIGLNYVSGLIHLLLDSFNEPDGKNRFELALDRMVSENYDFLPVLKNTFRLMDIYNIDAGKREMLGSSLIAFIPKYAEHQYKNLKDTHSLAYLLKQAASKINDIGGSLDGRL